MIKIKVRYLKSISEKATGLIGLTKINPVFFNTRFGIHTFGMKVPIDVFILSKEFRVVRTKRRLLPGKFFFWNPIYNNVLETPCGLIKNISEIKLIF